MKCDLPDPCQVVIVQSCVNPNVIETNVTLCLSCLKCKMKYNSNLSLHVALSLFWGEAVRGLGRSGKDETILLQSQNNFHFHPRNCRN